MSNYRQADTRSIKSREKDRERIEREINQFLAHGGHITVVNSGPPKNDVPTTAGHDLPVM